MSDERKPEFIIIGAVKAATTWTALQLDKNPSLFVPGPEPHYFSTEYHQGKEWYDRFFDTAAETAIIGEKSADYLAHPKAAERIAADLPDTKLIVQLRNPVDRAYSDYCMLYRRGTIRQSPEEYFNAKNEYQTRFLRGGLYAENLKTFFDRFSQDKILALLFEDIKDRPEWALDQVSAHIGVATHIEEENLTTRQNDSAAPLLPLPVRRALKPFKKMVEPLRGQPIFEAVRGAFARELQYPPLGADACSFLQNYYREDIEKLGKMINRDLSAWLNIATPDAERSPRMSAIQKAGTQSS